MGRNMQKTVGAKRRLSARIGRNLPSAATLALMLALTGPQPAAAQSYTFTAVTIEGNTRVDAATILAFAALERGNSVSAAALNDAYQRIVNSGLFESVELRPQGGTLVIAVKELPMVDILSS